MKTMYIPRNLFSNSTEIQKVVRLNTNAGYFTPYEASIQTEHFSAHENEWLSRSIMGYYQKMHGQDETTEVWLF